MARTFTTGELGQLEGLISGLKENSEDKVRQALTVRQQPDGQRVDVASLLRSAMPAETKAAIEARRKANPGIDQLFGQLAAALKQNPIDAAGKAAGAVSDTLGRATDPLQAWEADEPSITMAQGSMYDNLLLDILGSFFFIKPGTLDA
ncbi:hypothetical protein [Streptomyces sp. NPDC101150]|uniref:hypothetical protein n=1 Tax=Streptomyces sp. NPDC101150 TaxID=3366114 RepID=UPI003823AE05